MRIIVPSVEVMRNGLEEEMILPEQFIERVGRTCYKSEDKITPDSAAKFVSGVRHYLKWLRGDKDEPHDRAFVWNLMCCIWEVDYHKEETDV